MIILRNKYFSDEEDEKKKDEHTDLKKAIGAGLAAGVATGAGVGGYNYLSGKAESKSLRDELDKEIKKAADAIDKLNPYKTNDPYIYMDNIKLEFDPRDVDGSQLNLKKKFRFGKELNALGGWASVGHDGVRCTQAVKMLQDHQDKLLALRDDLEHANRTHAMKKAAKSALIGTAVVGGGKYLYDKLKKKEEDK